MIGSSGELSDHKTSQFNESVQWLALLRIEKAPGSDLSLGTVWHDRVFIVFLSLGVPEGIVFFFTGNSSLHALP
jgi:hypothetical protein